MQGLYYVGNMAYPYTPKLNFPFADYKVNGDKFGKRCRHDGIDWGVHLGEDCNIRAGTRVKAIGRGKVVYSALHASEKSPKRGGKRNWGNIVIIAHKHPRAKKVFFSLYAHLGKRLVEKGSKVSPGDVIGVVGRAWSQENGWWEESHLHLGVYLGPWKGVVLPGYWKKDEKRTRFKDWVEPSKFIKSYR